MLWWFSSAAQYILISWKEEVICFYYCCRRGNRFCSFQTLPRKCPGVIHNHFGWVEDREVKQPSDTIFSHPPPTFALFLAHGSNEGTSPGLWFYLIVITKESFSSQKALAQSQGEILPVSTWLIITSCFFKCTPAQRYLVISREQDCGPDPKLSLESLFFLSRKPRKGGGKEFPLNRRQNCSFYLGADRLIHGDAVRVHRTNLSREGAGRRVFTAIVLPCLVFPFLFHPKQDIFYYTPQ